MRKLLTGLVIAAITTVLPTLAMADNQEVANEIARKLRDSGKLTKYKIGVKYQDGTAWLQGEVQDQQQLNVALKTVFSTPGVTRVVNQMTMRSVATAEKPSQSKPLRSAKGALAPEKSSVAQRLERIIDGGAKAQKEPADMPASGRADRIADSVNQTPIRQVSTATQRESTPVPQQTRTVAANPVRAAASHNRLPARSNRPIPVAYIQAPGGVPQAATPGGPIPAYVPGVGGGVAPARYDQPHLPNHSWPSYAAYPNYAAVTYPRQYSPTAWPFIGPFYPYPQVPLGWRKVTLEWDDGWWMLDFEDSPSGCGYR